MAALIRVIAAAGAVFIDGDPRPVPAGTLQASLKPDGTIAICNIMGGTALAAGRWIAFADADGAAFASADAAMAYLEKTLAPAPSRTVQAVAGADLLAGQPLAISRATGRLIPARADTYSAAFVAGLAMTDAAEGFAAQAGRGAVTLADWTAATGAAALVPGQPYFLAPAGGVSLEPRAAAAVCIARVGVAASPTVLIAAPTDPILL